MTVKMHMEVFTIVKGEMVIEVEILITIINQLKMGMFIEKTLTTSKVRKLSRCWSKL
jgi:hypothetical protein